MTKIIRLVPTALAVIGLIGLTPAKGELSAGVAPAFTFGFTDLDGDYTENGSRPGTFTIQASAESLGGPFNSSGDVTRVAPPNDTANYDAGFIAGGTAADFQMEMQVVGVTSNQAQSQGQFTITDADGDYITGRVNGSWQRLGDNFGSFSGTAVNVRLHENGNGIFEGPSGGSWGMDLPGGPIYNGAIIVLETGHWFTSSFNNANTLVQASLVPVPGAAVLAVIGLGLVARRRRPEAP